MCIAIEATNTTKSLRFLGGDSWPKDFILVVLGIVDEFSVASAGTVGSVKNLGGCIEIWVFPKIGSFPPKTDGENNGKPY